MAKILRIYTKHTKHFFKRVNFFVKMSLKLMKRRVMNLQIANRESYNWIYLFLTIIRQF